MRNLLYIALLAATVAPGASVERKAPDAMGYTKRILCDGKWRGHGIPTGSQTLATVAHVIEGCTVIGWDDSLGNHGTFTAVLRRRLETRKDEFGNEYPYRDYALLLSDTPFQFWASVSKREPRNGEILYSALILPGNNRLGTVSGPFVGVDGSGHYETDLASHPGSSGTPIMDQSGTVLAVNNGGYNAATGRSLCWATPVSQIFD